MGRIGPTLLLIVMCGLLVPACGSGSPAAPKKSHATPVTTQAVVRIGRFTEFFDSPLPADPAQASVAEGFRADLILWDKSQENSRLVPPVAADVTGSAFRNLLKSMTQAAVDKVVPAGTDRLFRTRVTLISDHSASITTCDDGSNLEEVNPATGVPDLALNTPADQQYVFLTWQMTRLKGQWAISAVSFALLPDPRAKSCQPSQGL